MLCSFRVFINVDLFILDVPLIQELLGQAAIGTPGSRINFDRHRTNMLAAGKLKFKAPWLRHMKIWLRFKICANLA